ncbi:hypothetical protein DICPUDRAFT_157551 [Dictyostelium purpureum]|uniref:B box-type domain-containing protein n=1 Tax=Dictyostelium purpureum TaxID=5786 RepID=F0ZZE7_DICPU|nr:uncharacterized protein DICPUDRAFT_157551 [Dictyostelium purpureum]EGC30694.1 hypothetical protein DICPUDRAFT_157551 [Dictyostelium purpureum]|eukprot:XP_003292792.1 hypothetical protein DICPUDRAFT_157551 [Dictyostelium purpureum]
MNSNEPSLIIKCSEHNKNFILICVVCQIPICLDCIVSGEHLNHKNNKMEHFTKENIDNIIIKDFKKTTYYLEGYIKSNKKILESSEKCYYHTKNNYKQQEAKINEIFKELHDRLDLLKTSKLLELEKDQNFSQIVENYCEYLIRFKIFCPELVEFQKQEAKRYNNNNNKKLDCLFSFLRYYSYFSNSHKKKLNISISSKILSNRNEMLMIKKLINVNGSELYYSNGEPIPTNRNKVFLDESIDYEKLILNDHVKELYMAGGYNERLNSSNLVKKFYINHLKREILKEKDKSIFLVLENSIVKYYEFESQYYCLIDKDCIDTFNIEDFKNENYLAFGNMGEDINKSLNLFSTISNYQSFKEFKGCFFVKGFNIKLELLSAYCLHLGFEYYIGIEATRLNKRILNNIKNLHLIDGFSLELLEYKYRDLEKLEIENLYLHKNIKTEVPFFGKNIAKRFFLCEGYNDHGIITIGSRAIELHISNVQIDIKVVLNREFLSDSSDFVIYLEGGFNQEINVSYYRYDQLDKLHLHIYDVGPKFLKSRVSSIIKLHIHGSIDGASNDFFNGIQELYLYNYTNVLEKNDICFDTIKHIYLMDGFNKSSTYQIPNNIKFLTLYNIGLDAAKNLSIPESVSELYLGDGFNIPLDKINFPKTLKSLHLGNVKSNISLIPSNFENLFIKPSFSMDRLKKSSIPFLKFLHLEYGFNQIINKDIFKDKIGGLVLHYVTKQVFESIPDNIFHSLHLQENLNYMNNNIKFPQTRALFLYPVITNTGVLNQKDIKNLNICDNFKSIIKKGDIHENIEVIVIDIMDIINNDSIPATVKEIYLKYLTNYHKRIQKK